MRMAQDKSKSQRQDTMAWIIVLAIAITLCAILFVVFATYLSSINRSLTVTNERLSSMEENEIQLLKEIKVLHRNLDPKTTH
jgi:ABC-type Fe3+ transport system permease subunit